MPFKSKAQRRKFAELLVKGEISPETYEEWNRETGRAELPERVKPEQKPGSRRKVRPKPKASRKAKPKNRAPAPRAKPRTKARTKRRARKRSI